MGPPTSKELSAAKSHGRDGERLGGAQKHGGLVLSQQTGSNMEVRTDGRRKSESGELSVQNNLILPHVLISV
jgi:hypothetical protein